MEPMGRKKIQMPDAKHHPKESGKTTPGWWENVVVLCKKRARREAKEQIKRTHNA